MKMNIVEGDINNEDHQKALLDLLNMYMCDPMGGGAPMTEKIRSVLVDELKLMCNFVFFLVEVEGRYVGLANCFIGFSTFYAKKLINIHDFAVDPSVRGRGFGAKLMGAVIEYARKKGFCKVTLEVRKDNPVAQSLYTKKGFEEGNPPYLFWENKI